MADNFLQSVNTGINLGHMADTNRMQRAQMERLVQQMQMEQLDRSIKLQTFLEGQQERSARKAMYAPESMKVYGGDEYAVNESTPGGPGREALKGQFPGTYNVLADQLLNFGKVDPGLATMLKPQAEKKIPLITGTDLKGNPVRIADVPGAIPYEKPNVDKTPAIPLFVDKTLPDGGTQKMRFNPTTQQHDIPFGNPEAPKKGMQVYDRDGNLILDTSGKGMTPKTKGATEEKIIAGREQLARIEAIANEFKPEYQEVGTRLKNSWTGLQARLGQGVAPEDAKKLTEFKAFQRKSIENINLYIKEVTGAQMSEAEADRIRLAQPDPGEKWYQGNDPITFKAKLDDVRKFTRAAVARYDYYLSKGFSPTEIKKMVTSGAAVSLEDLASKMK